MTQSRDELESGQRRGIYVRRALTAITQDTPIRASTIPDLVYLTIKKAVLTGQLPPGTRLIQTEVAAALGVSTTPVREALGKLSSEGVLRTDAYKGAQVIRPTATDVAEVYDIRIALVDLAMSEAVANISPKALTAAAALLDEMDDTATIAHWVEYNNDFHMILDEAVESRRLRELLTRLRETAMVMVGWSLHMDRERLRQANIEHRLILSAIERRDQGTASQLLKDHFTATLRLHQARDKGDADTASQSQQDDGAGTGLRLPRVARS